MARPEICTTYGHTLVANHECPNCTHRVCRWGYTDEKQIRVQAREQGIKPNLSGPHLAACASTSGARPRWPAHGGSRRSKRSPRRLPRSLQRRTRRGASARRARPRRRRTAWLVG